MLLATVIFLLSFHQQTHDSIFRFQLASLQIFHLSIIFEKETIILMKTAVEPNQK